MMARHMAENKEFPPPDYERSPYTGWTRAHWEALLARLTYGYQLVAERAGSPARALYPEDLRNQPDSVDALESFARIAPAWAAWLYNPSNPAIVSFAGKHMDLTELLCRALVEGTNPDRPHTYWGEMDHFSQHIVEAADVAIAVWLSRQRVFDQLNPMEQARIMAWLGKVDGKQTYFDNWILFPAISMMVRLKMGFPASVRDLDGRLEKIGRFYRGDGWYADGPGNEYELYNAWMFGWHYLLWAWIDGDRRPDLRQIVLRRAQSFIQGFQFFFGSNGVYPAWGRSIVYRFSAVAAFETAHLLGIAPANPGLLRRVSSGCMRYFYEHGFLDSEQHYIYQGFHGHFPQAGESYISPGSPYWACHALFALSFDRNDPFWTTEEAPLPVEQADFDLALPAPGFVLHGDKTSGQVLLLNSRSGPAEEILPDAGSSRISSEIELAVRYGPRHDYPSKYGKLAYSSHFPFNVAPIPGSYGPDAMLALSPDGQVFGHRSVTLKSGAAPGMIWSEFSENIAGESHLIRAAVLLWKDLQIRLYWIAPALPVRAFEAPGALSCDRPAGIQRRSDAEAGWEYAEIDGRGLAIQRLIGYDSQLASAPFQGYSNLNLAYHYSEFPLVLESWPSAATRSLAAVSLLRPARFDPSEQFAGIKASSPTAGVFHVSLPDGELAHIDLRDIPADCIHLGDFDLEGTELRLARLRPDGSQLCAINLMRVNGLIELEQPAIVQLRRENEGQIDLITDSGLTLASEWLKALPSCIQVQSTNGELSDVTNECQQAVFRHDFIQKWRERNERSLLHFRMTL
jgi:hypothetical protein